MPGSWVCVGGGGEGALTGSNNFLFGTAGSAGRTGEGVCMWVEGEGGRRRRAGGERLTPEVATQVYFSFPLFSFCRIANAGTWGPGREHTAIGTPRFPDARPLTPAASRSQPRGQHLTAPVTLTARAEEAQNARSPRHRQSTRLWPANSVILKGTKHFVHFT